VKLAAPLRLGRKYVVPINRQGAKDAKAQDLSRIHKALKGTRA